MKNIKLKKILILTVISVILISSVSVVCFADTDNGVFDVGDSFIFNESFVDNVYPGSPALSGEFYFINQDGYKTYFTDIEIAYRGYFHITYLNYDESGRLDYSQVVYDDGWVQDHYRTVYVNYPVLFTGDDLAFIYLNSSDPLSNYYSDIYDTLKDAIYGDLPITSDMSLSLSLVSTILSMLVVLAPILIGAFVFIFILKRV